MLIKQRQKFLSEALKIYEFIQNADETLDRIADKDRILTTDGLGDDVSGVEVLRRKHDAVQRDIAAIGKSFDEHVAEADRLLKAYPDRSANVEAKKEQLIEAWRAVNNKAAARKAKLDDSLDYQLYLVDFHDSITWIDEISQSIQEENHIIVTDTNGSASLFERHAERKGEIDARQSSFDKVESKTITAKTIKDDHYASAGIQECIEELRAQRKALDELWAARQEEFTRCHDQQLFNREAQVARDWIGQQEVIASQQDVGTSISTVASLLKKHDRFEKSLAAHNEKMTSLNVFAEKMIKYGHYDKEAISSVRDTVFALRKALDGHSRARRATLEDAMRYQEHKRDTEEMISWIHDKYDAIERDDPTQGNTINKIKKHADLNQEIEANFDGVQSLEKRGRQFISAGHFAKAEIGEHMASLGSEWSKLQGKSASQAQLLKSEQQIREFSRSVHEVDDWLDAKIVVAKSDNTGKDVEGCEVAQKSFEEFHLDVKANEARIAAINGLVAKLAKDKHPKLTDVHEKEAGIMSKWAELKRLSEHRKQALFEAHEIHVFIRDCDETLDRITDKDRILTTTELGDGVSGVDRLIRSHDGVQRDLVAVGKSVEDHVKEADRLVTAYPDRSSGVQGKKSQLTTAWGALTVKSSTRKDKLDDSRDLQVFLDEFNNAVSWIADISKDISAEDLAVISDVPGAESLLQRHQERKGEIDARQSSFDKVEQKDIGRIIKGDHYAAAEMDKCVAELSAARASLNNLWAKRNEEFLFLHKVQQFFRSCDMGDEWISSAQSIVQSAELGSSIDEVEGMLKKLTAFEKTLAAQEEKAKRIHAAAVALC